MGLQELWFILIAALFLGFLVLEGFDFGVGMLMAPFGLTGDGDPEPRRRAESPGPSGSSQRSEDKGGVLADYGLTEEQGNEIIMAARAHWFEDEAPEADADETTVEAASAEDIAAEDTAADTAADDVVADDAADTTDAKSEDDKA